MNGGIQLLTEFNPEMYANSDAPLVSIYMPTHRYSPENLQDRLRFKNLVDEAKDYLSQKYEQREYETILSNLNDLADGSHMNIWRFAKDGLAVLANNERTAVYQLDYPVEEILVVANSYHIKPLIRNFQYGAHYYLLALSADRFDLYWGDFHTIEKIEMPEGIENEFQNVFDDFGNTSSANIGTYGKFDRGYFGQESKSEEVEKEITKHFRYVDKVVSENFANEHHRPFILVTLPRHQSTFRSISTLPTLVNVGIEKPLESLSESELLTESISIIEGIEKSHISTLVEKYGLAQAQETGSSDPSIIAHALSEKKVSTLFVDQEQLVPGKFNEKMGLVSFDGVNGTKDDDLTDDFAQATYLQGGDVYVLDSSMMPSETGVAALFRY